MNRNFENSGNRYLWIEIFRDLHGGKERSRTDASFVFFVCTTILAQQQQQQQACVIPPLHPSVHSPRDHATLRLLAVKDRSYHSSTSPRLTSSQRCRTIESKSGTRFQLLVDLDLELDFNFEDFTTSLQLTSFHPN